MTSPVRIPADVDMADRVLGPLTARQLTILGTTALLGYLGFDSTRAFLPLPVFLAVAVPVGVTVSVVALGRRDGVSLDRMLLAAIRQRATPRHRVAAPEGVFPAPEWLTAHASTPTQQGPGIGSRNPAGPGRAPAPLRLPATSVRDSGTAARSGVGIVDLGVDGLAVVAVASTLNFALRTPPEQEALVAGFGRYLHSLTAPVQILIRAERLDLTAQIAELRDTAAGLPHPALEDAALEHADYLADLGAGTDLLRRQVLLILREPATATAPPDGLGGPSVLSTLGALRTRRRRSRGRVSARARQAAESRLARRLGEAVELLAPAGIVLTPLDAGRATAVLAAACNPDTMLPPSAGLAGAEDVITTAAPDTAGHSGYDTTLGTGRDWTFSTTDTAEDDRGGNDSGETASPRPRRPRGRGAPAPHHLAPPRTPDDYRDDEDEEDDRWAYDEQDEDNTVFDTQGRRR